MNADVQLEVRIEEASTWPSHPVEYRAEVWAVSQIFGEILLCSGRSYQSRSEAAERAVRGLAPQRLENR